MTAYADERGQLSAIRRIKQRETLRIAYGDFVRRQSIALVSRQISYLAEALVEAAVRCAIKRLSDQRGALKFVGAEKIRFAVLALGKLEEKNLIIPAILI